MTIDRDAIHQAQISAIKAARRAVGFAQQGALVSQTMVRNVKNQLDRVMPAQELPQTRQLLEQMLQAPVVPSEKRAFLAGEEIRKLYENVRLAPMLQIQLRETEDDTERDSLGCAPGQ